jgi:hypothetical protein
LRSKMCLRPENISRGVGIRKKPAGALPSEDASSSRGGGIVQYAVEVEDAPI